MCGRISLGTSREVLEARFDATAEWVEPRYNVAPGDELAVLTGETPDRVAGIEWGLVPEWADDPASFGAPINARSETAAEKPTFREAYRSRPCLVLVDGFYEWRQGRGASQPYRLTLTEEEPFALAGVWERHPEYGRTATVLTTTANDVVGEVHDRMPVILDRGEERTWLTADPEARAELLDPFPTERMRSYPVSKAVNDPANDSPELLEPADAGRQSGLGDFAG